MREMFRKKIQVGVLLMIAAGVVNAQQREEFKDIECKAPKSRLYKATSPDDAVDFELISAFEEIKKVWGMAQENQGIKGVLRYKDSKEKTTVVMPVLLSGRGNSRGGECTFKPFRMSFTTTDLSKQIEQSLLRKGIRPENTDYLMQYYKEFLATAYDIKTEGKPEKNSLFDNLGDDVKVVTHCGQPKGGGDWPGGALEVDQDQRLLMEHYLYEILNQTKLPVEKTRLSQFLYYNAKGEPMFKNDNGSAKVKFAFFREPPSSVAKRCGLLNKLPNGNAMNARADEMSKFALSVINQFVGNSDYGGDGGGKQGHNVNYFYDNDGRKYFGPYDFDLAYTTNNRGFERKIENLKASFKQTLSSQQNAEIKTILGKKFLESKDNMIGIVENSQLNQTYKAKALSWIKAQIEALEEVIQK